MHPPRRDPRHPQPDYDYLNQLGDEVISALTAAERDENQRALLVVGARELIERILEELVAIEDADPGWFGWAGLDPPRGTLRDKVRPDFRARADGTCW